MPTRIRNSARSAAVAGVVGEVDVGTTDPGGKLQFWSGARPNLGDAPAGDLLAEFDLPDPAFGAPTDGVAEANDLPLSTTGLEDGEITFARTLDRDGDVVKDTDDVGTSGTEIVVNTLSVSTGVDVSVTAWTVTMPAGA